MIIDTHTHLSTGSELLRAWAKANGVNFSVEGLLEEMEQNNVGAALVYAANVPEFALTNEELSMLVDGHKNLIPVATLPPDTEHVRVHELKDIFSTEHFRALKVYTGYIWRYPDCKKYESVWELCTTMNIPVIFHTGDTLLAHGKVKYCNPLLFDELAVDHPDLKIVLAHTGQPFFTEAAQVIYKNHNVFGDLACAVSSNEGTRDAAYLAGVRESLDRVFNYVGNPKKFVYGSDWPLCSMRKATRFVGDMHLMPGEHELIMQQNAKALFGL